MNVLPTRGVPPRTPDDLGPPPTPRSSRRLVRFGLTGCAGFVVDFGTLVLLHSGLGLPLWLATAAAYLTGGVVHYSLTRFWVFPQGNAEGEFGRIARYVLLVAANVGITTVIVVGLSGLGLDYRAAKVVAVVTLFFTNFILMPRLVMTSPRDEAGASRVAR